MQLSVLFKMQTNIPEKVNWKVSGCGIAEMKGTIILLT
jgi:hypothetical protein